MSKLTEDEIFKVRQETQGVTLAFARAIEAKVLAGITGDGRGEAKYCFYCRANTHNDSECWSTRPAGWKPDNTAQTAAAPLVPSPSVKFVWPPAQPQQQQAAPGAVPDGWQPIETAPKDGSMFLCWVSAERYSSPDGECSSHAHDTSQMDFCWWRNGLDGNGYFDPACGQIGDSQDVTHWMPLPPAPKPQEPGA